VHVAQLVQRAVLLSVARLHGVPAFALQAQHSVAEHRAVLEAARLSDAVVQELVKFDVFDDFIQEGRVPRDDEQIEDPGGFEDRIQADAQHEGFMAADAELGSHGLLLEGEG